MKTEEPPASSRLQPDPQPDVPLGFVGVGAMGAAMVQVLCRRGLQVHVYDTQPAAVDEAVRHGAVACASAAEVARRAAIVFACLPTPQASCEVAEALCDSGRCDTVVEMSTMGREAMGRVAATLARSGIGLVDCPLSGGPARARQGELTAIVAGDAARVQRVMPYLQSLASRIFPVGLQPGLAQLCKMVNNAVSLAGMVVACEAVVVGMKAGLSPATLIEVINASTGRNSATLEKFPRAIIPRSFDYGGPLSIGAKDFSLYTEEAAAEQVPSLVIAQAAQLWATATAQFGAGADMSNFMRLLEGWAGL